MTRELAAWGRVYRLVSCAVTVLDVFLWISEVPEGLRGSEARVVEG